MERARPEERVFPNSSVRRHRGNYRGSGNGSRSAYRGRAFHQQLLDSDVWERLLQFGVWQSCERVFRPLQDQSDWTALAAMVI
jgi:hypothetical protein